MAKQCEDVDLEPEPKSWNIWLTLMVISIAFTIVVAVLEYFGVFRDFGADLVRLDSRDLAEALLRERLPRP